MNWNSTPSYGKVSLDELHQSLGIMQFPSDRTWAIVSFGQIEQGGLVDIDAASTLVVPFVTPFPQQLLGLFIQPLVAGTGSVILNVDPALITLEEFTIKNPGAAKSFYWFAKGA